VPETHDPIALELFKNAIFAIADEMALTVFRTTYSGVLKDNMDYSTGFADARGKLAAQGLTRTAFPRARAAPGNTGDEFDPALYTRRCRHAFDTLRPIRRLWLGSPADASQIS
jgi:hypothetical protein